MFEQVLGLSLRMIGVIPLLLHMLKNEIIFPFFRLYAVAQLVEALRHKPGGRGFDSRWSPWDFSLN